MNCEFYSIKTNAFFILADNQKGIIFHNTTFFKILTSYFNNNFGVLEAINSPLMI
jgi:hypothetical protein